MRRLILIIMLFYVSSSQAMNCKETQNQIEINECASIELDKEDKLLNKVYSEFRRNLEKKEQEKLRTAQISWIKYRDQFCDFEGALVDGGQIQSLFISNCKRELTVNQRKRIEVLLR